MAIRRGEAEKCLRVQIEVNTELILAELHKEVIASAPTSTDVSAWMVSVVEILIDALFHPQ